MTRSLFFYILQTANAGIVGCAVSKLFDRMFRILQTIVLLERGDVVIKYNMWSHYLHIFDGAVLIVEEVSIVSKFVQIDISFSVAGIANSSSNNLPDILFLRRKTDQFREYRIWSTRDLQALLSKSCHKQICTLMRHIKL